MKNKVVTLVKKGHEFSCLLNVDPRTIKEYQIIFNRVRGNQIKPEYANLIVHRLKELGLIKKVKREYVVNHTLLNQVLQLEPNKVGVLHNVIYRTVYDACEGGADIAEIMERTGYRESRVRRGLYTLQQAGLVVREGVYCQLPFAFEKLEELNELAQLK